MECGDSLSPKFFEVHNQDRFFSSNQCDPIPCLSMLMATLSFCALGATHLENCNLPLSPSCLHPSLLQKVVKSLPNVHECKHWNVLLSQPFTNNLTAYKLFKSNLARVLRTPNHILALTAMTIFGHIFPLLQALHWLFFLLSPTSNLYLPTQNSVRKHDLSSGFPVPTNRKEESFLFLFFFQFFHLFLGYSLSPIVTEHPLCARCSPFASLQGRHYQPLGTSEEAKAWSRQVISSRPHNTKSKG